ncbi:MAG: hypothetical protein J6X58_04875 [Bacteroidales bacterium]|nr:hypothetical protein [Bacteroidales bacterium]
MRTKTLLFFLFFIIIGSLAKAQHFATDIMDENLRGQVKSVLTTVHTPQGKVVGHPMRSNFNREGYFSQNTYYDTMGNPVIIITYSYDKKNRLVKDVRTHEPYSELLSQTTYNYDKKKNTVTAEMFGIADSLEERLVYTFNKDGKVSSVATFDDSNKELAVTKYDYNEFGNRVFSTFTEGENAIYRGGEQYRYDTDGNLVEKRSYYLTTLRQAFLYTYHYDEHGNWDKAYVYHVTQTEGYLYQIITRQISYYE